MRRNELVVEVRCDRELCNERGKKGSSAPKNATARGGELRQRDSLTMTRKVKQGRKILHLASPVPRIGEPRVGVPELVEEGMHHGIHGGKTLSRRVLEQAGDQVDGIGVGLTEHLVERVRLDLRELVLHVVRVHGSDLFPSGRPQDLDDLDELVDARLSGEERLSQHELGHNAPGGPDVCFRVSLCRQGNLWKVCLPILVV